MRLMFDWLEDQFKMKDWWRYVSMECGAQCVVIDGIPEKLVLHVDNSGTVDVSLLSTTIFKLLIMAKYSYSIYSTAKQLRFLNLSITISELYLL